MALIKIDGKAKFTGKTIFDAGYIPTDSDAISYIAAIEAADGASLEDPIKQAYENFIVGCKSDGIWSALKASCIMAGARTLNGALVPLVGTAPTNINFVSADYNRKTGLKGNGTTKYINTNRNNNLDPQDNRHLFVNITEPEASTLTQKYIAGMTNNVMRIGAGNSVNTHAFRCSSSTDVYSNSSPSTGGLGVARNNATQFSRIFYNSVIVASVASVSPSNGNQFIFTSNNTTTGGTTPNTTRSQSRLSFYSIGEFLSLSIIKSRVDALMTAINAAI